MFCTVSNKHTDTKITRIKQKYSNDNQKARRKIIELQPQNFIYSFQVKLNKTTYLSFKHITCRFMIESDNVTDNLVFAVNSIITLYQIRHFYLLAKWQPRSLAKMREATSLIVGRPTVRKMLGKKFDGIFLLEAGNPRKNIV